MGLTILNVAYPLVPVGPDTVGGAEQLVSTLDREIERAGHRSIVIAAEGSVTSGTLIASPRWDGPISSSVRKWAAREHARILSDVLRRITVDVVHLHGLDFLEYLPEESVPCIASLHLPPEWYPAAIFNLRRSETFYVCVSADQRRRCPSSLVPLRTIPHGIDMTAFSPSSLPGNYALVLGRICAEKGFHFAIDAAERADVTLLIAGQVYPYSAHEKYFRSEIAPRLNERIRFIGPAGLHDKRRLLSQARCVLIPSTVAETSSLVAMEALASGTPVIAFPSGALKEIVEHEKTGFLVNEATEMSDAISCADRISREVCRRTAEIKFDLGQMMRRYCELYTEVSEGVKLLTRGNALK